MVKDRGGKGVFSDGKCRTEKAVSKQEGKSSNREWLMDDICIWHNKLSYSGISSLQIKKVTEMSLSANQERGEMEKRRLAWKVEGGGGGSKLVRGGAVDPAKLLVELAPMEIRTFLIDVDYIQLVGG